MLLLHYVMSLNVIVMYETIERRKKDIALERKSDEIVSNIILVCCNLTWEYIGIGRERN